MILMRDFILNYSASFDLSFDIYTTPGRVFKLLIVDCYQSFLLIRRVYWIVLHYE